MMDQQFVLMFFQESHHFQQPGISRKMKNLVQNDEIIVLERCLFQRVLPSVQGERGRALIERKFFFDPPTKIIKSFSNLPGQEGASRDIVRSLGVLALKWPRSDERRGGQECESTGRLRWSR